MDKLLARATAAALAHAIARSCEIKADGGRARRARGRRCARSSTSATPSATRSRPAWATATGCTARRSAAGMVMAADLSRRLGLRRRGGRRAPARGRRGRRPAGARRRAGTPRATLELMSVDKKAKAARSASCCSTGSAARACRRCPTRRWPRRSRPAPADAGATPMDALAPYAADPDPDPRPAPSGGGARGRAPSSSATATASSTARRSGGSSTRPRSSSTTRATTSARGSPTRSRSRRSRAPSRAALRLQRGPDRGDRARARPRPHAVRPRRRGRAERAACSRTAASSTTCRRCASSTCSRSATRAFDGLNLTFETREGILKHCSLAQRARSWARSGERFVERTRPSLEAQLANLADEIAYNNHDVDDGLRSGLLGGRPAGSRSGCSPTTIASVQAAFPDVGERRQVYETVRRMINELVLDLTRHSGALIAAAVARVERRGEGGAAADRVLRRGGGARRAAEVLPVRQPLPALPGRPDDVRRRRGSCRSCSTRSRRTPGCCPTSTGARPAQTGTA